MRCVRKPPNERPLTDGTTAASAPSARARKSTSPVHSIVVWPRSHRTTSMLRRSGARVGHVGDKGEKTGWADRGPAEKKALRRLSDFSRGGPLLGGSAKPRGRRLSQGDRDDRRREGETPSATGWGDRGPRPKNAQAAEGFREGGPRFGAGVGAQRAR